MVFVMTMAGTDNGAREREVQLKSIFEGTPLLQFVIDRDHRILSWNKAMEIYSGIKAADVLGTTDQWRAFYPEKRPILADLLVDDLIEHLPEWYEGKYRKSRMVDGAYEASDFFPRMGVTGTWLFFTAAPVRDADGVMIGAVETLQDITEQKKAEVSVKESNEQFLSFIREAAMRLKNPMEVVEENLSLMVNDIEHGPQDNHDLSLQLKLQIKNLEQIRQNIIELNKVIVDRFGILSDASKKFLTE
jgi:PAS domain S-box-containing protein